jgi:TatD DNase family protein
MIDTHAHLDFRDFDLDRADVIQRAFSGSLSSIVNIGTDCESSLKSVELADSHDRIFAAVGVHPHDAKMYDRKIRDRLARLAQHPKVVAIGEIGLDYYRNYSPHEVQQKAFADQLAMAREFRLPVVVHIREAMEDSLRILRESGVQSVGGVLHCFPGTAEEARQAAGMNLFVSFGGSLTFEKSRSAKTAAEVPLEMIVLETDCPFITPVPHRGKRNEPSYVRYAYEAMSRIKGIPVDSLEKSIDSNAVRLFNLGDGIL